MNDEDCRCGHSRLHHRARGCAEIVAERSWLDFDICPCRRFDSSRLPATGERLEFGKHRLSVEEAESAPAWPSLVIVQRTADKRFRAEQKKVRS